MDVSHFNYELPQELIAQSPLPDRGASRLLVLEKATGSIKHRQFRHLANYLQPGDGLVVNNSRVIPARLFGVKGTGAHVEMLLLKPLTQDRWEVLVKPGRKVPEGTLLRFGEGELTAEVLERTEAGGRVVRLSYGGILQEVLDRLGEMPLPPYIKERLPDKERYQTVYAKEPGSAAAPTAGLHFTQEFLQELQERGVHIIPLTLHVGLGTFRPVSVEVVEDHQMHAEYYELSETSAQLINQVKREGKRLVAVGTTSCRTLEGVYRRFGRVQASSGWTDIFIYPGYAFDVVESLLTNFHLPQSTLMMLISALAGREKVFRAYEEAVQQRYRFFSFGDAMLIL